MKTSAFYRAESSDLASITNQNKCALQGALREKSEHRKTGSVPIALGIDSAKNKNQ